MVVGERRKPSPVLRIVAYRQSGLAPVVPARASSAVERYYRKMGGEGDCDLWAEGARLFNEGRYFECHEVWERLWKRSSGAEKLFYQGMIQTAAALLHVRRGELRGARSTWSKARPKLDRLPLDHRGIALGELRAAVDGFLKAALAEVPLPPFPTITLTAPGDR